MTILTVVTCVMNVFEVQSAIGPYSPLGEVTQFFFFETSAHGAV